MVTFDISASACACAAAFCCAIDLVCGRRAGAAALLRAPAPAPEFFLVFALGLSLSRPGKLLQYGFTCIPFALVNPHTYTFVLSPHSLLACFAATPGFLLCRARVLADFSHSFDDRIFCFLVGRGICCHLHPHFFFTRFVLCVRTGLQLRGLGLTPVRRRTDDFFVYGIYKNGRKKTNVSLFSCQLRKSD